MKESLRKQPFCFILFICGLFNLISINSSHAIDLGGDIGIYYRHNILEDTKNNIKADGIQVAGVSLRFPWFHAAYETKPDSTQKDLKKYTAATEGSLKDYYDMLKVGIKPLKAFTDDDYVIEYSNEVYLAKMDSLDRYYRQEMLFLGIEAGDERFTPQNNGSISGRVKLGVFAAKNTVQELNLLTNTYSEPRNRDDAYGLMLQVNELYIKAKGFDSWGFLVDDLKLQYQLGGGNSYIFGVALGIAGKAGDVTWFAKYGWDLFYDKHSFSTANSETNTVTGKATVGVNYLF